MLSSARSPLGRAAFSRRRCGVGAPARAAQPARADAAASLHSVRAADDSLGAWILHAADKGTGQRTRAAPGQHPGTIFFSTVPDLTDAAFASEALTRRASCAVLSVSEASPSWAPPTDAPLPAFTARALTSTDKSHLARCEFVAKMARKALGEEVHDECVFPPPPFPPLRP